MKMIKKIVLLTLFIFLTACSSWQDLKAPCTYDSRYGCGAPVPINQGVNPSPVYS